jgi:hypothetical protein
MDKMVSYININTSVKVYNSVGINKLQILLMRKIIRFFYKLFVFIRYFIFTFTKSI